MRVSAFSALLVAALAAPSAHAHPHIFVETGLRLIHDGQGRLAALEITWTYDELFSLLLLEDLELDSDFDGVLTPEELERLQGFDMDWPEGYEGDVYVSASGLPVALGAPEAGPAELLGNGMLRAVHRRPLIQPVDAATDAVVVSVYDPTFYTAYTIHVPSVTSDWPACTTAVYTPDLDTAYAALEVALEELMADNTDMDLELDFPPVGDTFAEEVRLTCDGGS